MGYSNFKDPIGLLKRMLFSGNKVAYSVLFREILGQLLTPIDMLLYASEKRKLKKSPKESKAPIILILGGSRSGTTLLYQVLAQYLPVSYFSNFIASFPRSPISAQKLFGNMIARPNTDFQNYFGSVAGLGGPNDAFGIWNRWLGEDRNRIPETISEKSKSDMQVFFNSWLQVTKKPFLNKNNRNSLCAPLFDALFDNILFIEIYRNPVFVVQSLIMSRRKVQGSDKIAWGLLSNDSDESDDPLHYIEGICRQVYRVDQVIARGREKINPNKYIRISYEEFCNDPENLIRKVGLHTKIPIQEPKSLKGLKFSTNSNTQRLNDDEFNRICKCVDQLYAKDLSLKPAT